MNSKIKYIAVGLLFLTNGFAQNINQLVFENVKSVQKEDMLYIDMDIDVTNLTLANRKAIVITPVISNAFQSLELPSVRFDGKTSYKVYNRKERLKSKKRDYKQSILAVRTGKKVTYSKYDKKIVPYSIAIPYNQWMDFARVEVKTEVASCTNCYNAGDNKVVANSIELDANALYMYKPSPVLDYIVPRAEQVKSRNLAGTALLDFPSGKSNIMPEFRNNAFELNKIKSVIDEVRANKYASLTSVDLRGYASPEGSYKTNEKLSTARSFALSNFLQTAYKMRPSLFKVSAVAEDWDGLLKLVEASDINKKSEIISIINNAGFAPDVKEQKLKALGTATYSVLLNEFFPSLRRVEYKANYTIRAFSVEEGKTIIKETPAEMSLNEMFLVANTYKKGSAEFNEVFDIAVRIFPHDEVAKINAGTIALQKGNLADAHKYLNSMTKNKSAWNSIGVMYMLEKNYALAEEYFKKASTVEAYSATANLEELSKLRESQLVIEAREARRVRETKN